MRRLEYEAPGEIDADPVEVGALAVEQLKRLIPALAQVVRETEVQMRSSYLSLCLDKAPGLLPEDLAEAWEESALSGRIARVRGAVETAQRIAERL